ncbi:DUF2624 domain-containing protein [Halobacillus salinarum]|uniref:DUF2624 domain-containing protein n=1 Tax=Halobacillus salinarum TaxID=2932257 RepID=A0ABY4EDH6_9BACI|nr:DUF2624 domain-containing protein [Halobacillus salinarum]UOQ42501.1 DUF2624 domain-containing protein [Halobacillus salinarum]
MVNVLQQIITQKLKQLTVNELMQYSQKYNIPITKEEAAQIIKALKKNKENPFEKEGRKRMLNQLAAITSKDTAKKVNQLLKKLAKEYGVEHWLK